VTGFCPECQEAPGYCECQPDPDEISDRLEIFAALGGPLTGDEVLRQVHSALTRYVVFTSPEAADAVTLYIAATHAQPAWQNATRLVVKSAEKRCGKSKLFQVARELVHRPVPAVNISGAALVRSIDDKDPPTLIVDEADRTFGGARGSSESTEVVIGILNAGFDRGWPYLRWDVTTRAPEECPSFCMAMLAVKGIDLPDTIEDRAVIVRMRRKLPGETVTKFRTARSVPALRSLRDRIGQWVIPMRGVLERADPAMPDGLDDRAEDLWAPLLAIADAAGGTWPKRARRAARALAAERAEADTDSSYGVRLLSDIRDLYGGFHVSFMPSRELLGRLVQLDEAPWRDLELTTRGLADRLRAFGIRSCRNTTGTVRGYRLEDFADAFGRYLGPSAPAPPSGSVNASETFPDLAGSSDGSGPSDTSIRQTGSTRQTLTWESDRLTGSDDPPGPDEPPAADGRVTWNMPDGTVGVQDQPEQASPMHRPGPFCI
jgi:hypothetical protein